MLSEVNEEVVQRLVDMGFPAEACRKAVTLTGNWGTEAAMNWIMEHMDDPDFADPLPPLPPPPRKSGLSSRAGLLLLWFGGV